MCLMPIITWLLIFGFSQRERKIGTCGSFSRPALPQRDELRHMRKQSISGSDAALSHESYISLGDEIYCHEETTDGYFSCEGFTQLNLCLEHESNLTYDSAFGHSAIFRLVPQQTYTMAKQLRSFDAHPPDAGVAALRERRAQLLTEAKREKELNESEVQNTAGREVRYGKILQLQHVVSGKFIAVSHLASEHHRDARRVHLADNDVGDAAWFRIVPKLRMHADGEKVSAGDPVMFENVISGLKLHFGNRSGDATGIEINAFGDE